MWTNAAVWLTSANSGGKQRIDGRSFWKLLQCMRAVGLKTLKNKLSEYIRIAAGGETVLVTDRERVVAEIVPPRAGRAVSPADATLAEAVRRGWVTPPLMASDEPPPRKPEAPFAALMEELQRDREDR